MTQVSHCPVGLSRHLLDDDCPLEKGGDILFSWGDVIWKYLGTPKDMLKEDIFYALEQWLIIKLSLKMIIIFLQ